MKSRVLVFITLAITQIAGWGVVGILPVLASSIAKDLQIDSATAFLGVTAMYVVMGLSAPVVGKAFARLGVKHVMLCGASVICIGLAAMGASTHSWPTWQAGAPSVLAAPCFSPPLLMPISRSSQATEREA